MTTPHELTDRANRNGIGGFYFFFPAADVHLIRGLRDLLNENAKLQRDECPHATAAVRSIESFARVRGIEL